MGKGLDTLRHIVRKAANGEITPEDAQSNINEAFHGNSPPSNGPLSGETFGQQGDVTPRREERLPDRAP